MGPLVGHAFITAVQTYADVSGSAGGAAALAQGISPLDGLLVPTFGAYALVATLLLPFVAIRAVADDKTSGGLALLVQGPTSLGAMMSIKFLVLVGIWMLSWLPGIAALALWSSYGGHLHGNEVLVVFLGYLLRGVVVIATAFCAAAVTDSAASAAIVALSITVGSWALDFLAQVQGGLAQRLAQFTPESVLRLFEQGEWNAAITVVSLVFSFALLIMATIWLHPGTPRRTRVVRSAMIFAFTVAAALASSMLRVSVDASEDRRNSLAVEDEHALMSLRGPILVTAHLAPEDPRLTDLQRSVLHKIERVTEIRLTTTARTSTGMFERPVEGYGEIWYEWNGQRRMTRSTTLPIVLEMLYDLTGLKSPTARGPSAYPGYPLKATPRGAAVLFYVVWPALLLGVAVVARRTRNHPQPALNS